MSRGNLTLVSLGPGAIEHLTPAAEQALKGCDIAIGYSFYIDLVSDLLAGKEVISSPIGSEIERADQALRLARDGKRVALISSGDIGIYAMAGVIFERLEQCGSEYVEIAVIPGITAATASAALLGSPLTHDFATLSLSDLLCPWQTIEKRASKLAEADLCIALYNVQSKGRSAGVYRIIELLLAHKPETTVCGLVRNAYRPNQQIDICTLAELRSRSFDMFTTILIGNSATRHLGRWIYTPRGYASKPGAEETDELLDVPSNAVWVFTGTGDGNSLATMLADSGEKVVVSVASEYGALLARQACPRAHVISGRLGKDKRGSILKRSQARAIVDATHPHAEAISTQLLQLSEQASLPYIRYLRGAPPLDSNTIVVQDAVAAAAAATNLGSNILVASGTRHLSSMVSNSASKTIRWFARVLPDSESLAAALHAGIAPNNICAMQGPFSKAFNVAQWQQWKIDCVITKESGEGSGFREKQQAAQELGIPLVVIQRPNLDYPNTASDFGTVKRFIHDCSKESN